MSFRFDRKFVIEIDHVRRVGRCCFYRQVEGCNLGDLKFRRGFGQRFVGHCGSRPPGYFSGEIVDFSRAESFADGEADFRV